jgi:gliding motility-associated-like protein
MNKNSILFASFILSLFSIKVAGQLPCTGNNNIIYYLSQYSTSTPQAIYMYDPSQPIVAGINPVQNTIPISQTVYGFVVSPNLSGTGPSPTFYITAGIANTYHYYDGTNWVNTGHVAGSQLSAVNPGGGNNYIFNLDIVTGEVSRYDGTGNAVPLISVQMMSQLADLAVDCQDNFYILYFSQPQKMVKYDQNGNILTTYSVIGTPVIGGGGGLAIIGNDVYYDDNNNNIYRGVISGTTVNFSIITSLFPGDIGDFAVCNSNPASVQASKDTIFSCNNGIGIDVYATGTGPFTWTLLSGTATMTTLADTATITATTTSQILVSAQGCNNAGDTVTFIISQPADKTDSIQLCPDSAYQFGSQTITEAGIYTHTFQTIAGCDSIVTLTVDMGELPAQPTFQPPNICLDGSIQLDITEQDGMSYQWNFDGADIVYHGGQSYTISWKDTGIKVVSVSIDGKCGSIIYTDTIMVYGIPHAEIKETSFQGMCGGDTVLLAAYEENGINYKWLLNNNYVHQGPSVNFVPYQGYATLIATNEYHCSAADSILIDIDPCCIMALPSAFTPNNDGRNDLYRIISLGYNELEYFLIANRFGEIVFQTKTIPNGWDGRYKEEVADIGTYYYILRYKCFNGEIREKKGDLILIR